MAREETTTIKPSPQARRLFSQMVARSEDLHLSLSATLELSVERVSSGNRDHTEIHELVREEWIDQAPDGGWLLH